MLTLKSYVHFTNPDTHDFQNNFLLDVLHLHKEIHPSLARFVEVNLDEARFCIRYEVSNISTLAATP